MHEPFWSVFEPRMDQMLPAQAALFLSTDSLTARLVALAQQPLQVKVVRQGWQFPSFSEQRHLAIAPRQYAWVREVVLSVENQPWVWARTVAPQAGLRAAWRAVRWLRQRPLGHWIFMQQDIQRSHFELCQTRAGDGYAASLAQHLGIRQGCWARRSRFVRQASPLLVSEVFLPALWSQVAAQ